MLIGVLNKYAHYTCKSEVAGLLEQPAVHYENILKKGIKELKIINNLVYLIVKDTILYSLHALFTQPSVNFINVERTRFLNESHFGSFF
jgi:hypothetical protein